MNDPQSKKGIKISVVVPVYNEIDNVHSLANEIKQALHEEYVYEIVFVDDGSRDGTWERLVELKGTFPELALVRHDKNYGQSAGIVSGIRHAQFEWIATLDGDGQNNPADIPKLATIVVEQLKQDKLAAVMGNRAKRHDKWLRRVSSKVANKVRGWLLRDDCPDTGCSLKLFPRDVFLALPHFNHLHRFLPALFSRAGMTIINVPVSHRYRLHGQSKYGLNNRLWAGIIDLLGIMWLIRRPCQPHSELHK